MTSRPSDRRPPSRTRSRLSAKESAELDALFERARKGDSSGNRRIVELLYPELRGLAHNLHRKESPGQTLDPTGLVHELYLRLIRTKVPWSNRGHFFSVAATTMLRLIVARAKSRKRRRHRETQVRSQEPVSVSFMERSIDVMSLHEGLAMLAKEAPRAARVVKLRFLVGRTNREISRDLGIPLRTVERELHFARAFLHERLG